MTPARNSSCQLQDMDCIYEISGSLDKCDVLVRKRNCEESKI